MNINKEFPGKWFTEVDLNGKEAVMKIRNVTKEELGRPGDLDLKPVLWFEGQERGFALNVTNRNTIVGMYGPETDNWNGREITVYPTETEFAGKMVPCIRVRTKPPTSPSADIKTTLLRKRARELLLKMSGGDTVAATYRLKGLTNDEFGSMLAVPEDKIVSAHSQVLAEYKRWEQNKHQEGTNDSQVPADEDIPF